MAETPPSEGKPQRSRVLIAGGGVAALETMMALADLAGDRAQLALLAPNRRFVHRPLSVAEPFTPARARGYDLESMAAEFGAELHEDALARVNVDFRTVVTRSGEELTYDLLVMALGAFPYEPWEEGITFRDGRDAAAFRLLLHRLEEGQARRVAFVLPAGNGWPLPLYELALQTAAFAKDHDLGDVELSLVTPESGPLAIFGLSASDAVATLLSDRGIEVHTSSYAEPDGGRRLRLTPGDRLLEIDALVALPRLAGPRIRGLPCDPAGFLTTDAHGRVRGARHVFAAGDCTSFSIKQGGLAAQQADAVAQMIAAELGAGVEPEPFRPVLRGMLLTGEVPEFLRANISGRAGDDSIASTQTLWWPPSKVAGRYLAPYLGGAADPLAALAGAGAPAGIPIETDLETSETLKAYAPPRPPDDAQLVETDNAETV